MGLIISRLQMHFSQNRLTCSYKTKICGKALGQVGMKAFKFFNPGWRDGFTFSFFHYNSKNIYSECIVTLDSIISSIEIKYLF